MNEKIIDNKKLVCSTEMDVCLEYQMFLMFLSKELGQGSIAWSFVSVFFHNGNTVVCFSTPHSQLPYKNLLKVNKHMKMHITYGDINAYMCADHLYWNEW